MNGEAWKESRAGEIALVAGVAVLLLAPALARLAGVDVVLQENRRSVPCPTIRARALLTPSFYRDLDTYFNDRFTLRGALILAKSVLDVRLFRTSPSPLVRIGREGWLYFRSELPDYGRTESGRQERMDLLWSMLHGVDGLLREKGKRFFFLVAPNKSTIYPEYVGYEPPTRRGGTSAYERLLALHRERPLPGLVRVDDILTARKPAGLLYDKGDTHWNGAGGAWVAEQVLNAVATGDQSPIPLPTHRLQNEAKVGDLNRMLGLPLRETGVVARDFVYAGAVSELHTPATALRGQVLRFRRATLPGDPGDVAVVMYRDSFANALLPFLKGAFRSLDVFTWASGVPSPEGEDWTGVDVVILECVERNLADLDINLDRIRAMLSVADGTAPPQGVRR